MEQIENNIPFPEYLPNDDQLIYRDTHIDQAADENNVNSDHLRAIVRCVDAINTEFNPAVEWENDRCSEITDTAYILIRRLGVIFRNLVEGVLGDDDREKLSQLAPALCRVHSLTAQSFIGHDYPTTYPVVVPMYTIPDGCEEYLPEDDK